jgi:hypothetical protein
MTEKKTHQAKRAKKSSSGKSSNPLSAIAKLAENLRELHSWQASLIERLVRQIHAMESTTHGKK